LSRKVEEMRGILGGKTEREKVQRREEREIEGETRAREEKGIK